MLLYSSSSVQTEREPTHTTDALARASPTACTDVALTLTLDVALDVAVQEGRLSWTEYTTGRLAVASSC